MTAFFMPEGHNADHFRSLVLEQFDMSLGVGLSKLAGNVVRIGHLGSFNDLMLAGTLGGVEMGLRLAGVPHREGGVSAALGASLRKSQPNSRSDSGRLPSSQLSRQADGSFPQAAELERALKREVRGEVRFDRGSRALRDRRIELSPDSDRPRHPTGRGRCDRRRGGVPRSSSAGAVQGRWHQPRRPVLQRGRRPRLHQVHEPDPRDRSGPGASRASSPASSSTRCGTRPRRTN